MDDDGRVAEWCDVKVIKKFALGKTIEWSLQPTNHPSFM
jgi:hypothetical protein